jgi:hypothetical protein
VITLSFVAINDALKIAAYFVTPLTLSTIFEITFDDRPFPLFPLTRLVSQLMTSCVNGNKSNYKATR